MASNAKTTKTPEPEPVQDGILVLLERLRTVVRGELRHTPCRPQLSTAIECKIDAVEIAWKNIVQARSEAQPVLEKQNVQLLGMT
jgi:hypothetical protein